MLVRHDADGSMPDLLDILANCRAVPAGCKDK